MTGSILHLTVPLVFPLHLTSVHQESCLTQPAALQPALVLHGNRAWPGVKGQCLMETNRGKSGLRQPQLYSLSCYFVIIYHFNLLTVKDEPVLCSSCLQVM